MLKNKNLMVISINVESEFDKIMIKTSSNLRIERNYLNIINTTYKNSQLTNINGKRLRAFPLTSETRKGCPVLPLQFNILLKFLTRAIRLKLKK